MLYQTRNGNLLGPQKEFTSIRDDNESSSAQIKLTASSDDAIRKEMKAMDLHYEGKQIVKDMCPSQVWEFAADTDSLNRAVGTSSAKVAYKRAELGSNSDTLAWRRDMEWNLPGNRTLRYFEDPFQWDKESHWWSVIRRPHDGPLKTVAFFVRVHPARDNANDSAVEMISAFQARRNKDEAKEAVESMGLIMHKMLERPLNMVSNRQAWKLATTMADQVKLDVCTRSLHDLGEKKAVIDSLVSHIVNRQESDLVDMQPLKLAAKWKQSEQDTISCFLRAARVGLLEPKWSLMCPMCRGSKGTKDKAFELAKDAHCADCDIKITSNPRSSMQMVFCTSVRPLADQAGRACVGSAPHTPHILAQANLSPGESRCIMKTRNLDQDASLRVICPELGSELDTHGKLCGEWSLDDSGIQPCGHGILDCFIITNNSPMSVRVMVQDRDETKYGRALSAEMVMNAPGFKTLFGAEEWDFLSVMVGKWKMEFESDQLITEEEKLDESIHDEFDIAVIGSGPGGETLALTAAKLGKKVALVEQAKTFGGPTGLGSKAFREAALKVLSWTKLKESRPDPEKIQNIFNSKFATFRDYAVTLVSHELMCRLGNAGVSLIRGRGLVKPGGVVEVQRPDGKQDLLIRAPVVGLAVGSKPARPKHIPFDGKRVLDAQEICASSQLPKSIAIIGGGIIAIEYASIFGVLGVQTHVINKYPTFVPMLDPATCDALIGIIESTGVLFHRGVQIENWANNESEEPVTLSLSSGGTIDVDVVLYAQGREGPTDNLVSPEISLTWGKNGFLNVDQQFQASTKTTGIYAIGDVVGGGVASTAMDHGQRLADSLFGCGGSCEHEPSPLVLWAIPEVASVGLSKEKAQAENQRVMVARAHYRELPRGLLTGDLDGRLDMVVNIETGIIVGVHLLGTGSSELVHYGSNLISQRTTVHKLSRTVFAAVTLHGLFAVAAERARLELSENRLKTK